MQWFAITVGRGTPEWPLLRLCRNSPPDLTPPFITVCRWFTRRHDLDAALTVSLIAAPIITDY